MEAVLHCFGPDYMLLVSGIRCLSQHDHSMPNRISKRALSAMKLTHMNNLENPREQQHNFTTHHYMEAPARKMDKCSALKLSFDWCFVNVLESVEKLKRVKWLNICQQKSDGVQMAGGRLSYYWQRNEDGIIKERRDETAKADGKSWAERKHLK